MFSYYLQITEYVGIRQRDVCSYLIRDDDENAALAMKTGISVKRSKYPFFGMDIEKDEFCTVDANRIIKFWTLDTCRYKKRSISAPYLFNLQNLINEVRFCVAGVKERFQYPIGNPLQIVSFA